MTSLFLASCSVASASTEVTVSDPNVFYSPYNWHRSGSEYAQTPNPGAYMKVGFTGTSLTMKIDVSSFTKANVPAGHYPMVRYSIDNGPATDLQLTPLTASIECAKGLKEGSHTLLFQYVAGYVFLDFWSPINAIRVTGLTLDDGAKTVAPPQEKRFALFLGDSITNGDDNIATFKGGITNEVDTQDATIGYPSVVAAATKAEYGVVAYGGASWGSTAADGATPGLMTFWSMVDKEHSRLVDGKFSPIPDDIYVNMGENRAPSQDDVINLASSLRSASSLETNIFFIVPFSGRAREPIVRAVTRLQETAGWPPRLYLIDLGDNPYVGNRGPTMYSVDGQHPLATLDGILGAQIVAERARLLAER